jgi:hypothetical protein
VFDPTALLLPSSAVECAGNSSLVAFLVSLGIHNLLLAFSHSHRCFLLAPTPSTRRAIQADRAESLQSLPPHLTRPTRALSMILPETAPVFRYRLPVVGSVTPYGLLAVARVPSWFSIPSFTTIYDPAGAHEFF